MSECEFYAEKPGQGAGGAKYVRELCSLTGRWCQIQVSCESHTLADRMKCERRLWALSYKSHHPRDAEESHEMGSELHNRRGGYYA